MLITQKQFWQACYRWENLIFCIFILASFSSCDLLSNDSKSKCKETEQPEFEKSFAPAIYVKNSKGENYWGAHVEINIYKEYCDGTIKGTFIKTATTLEDGYANFAYVFTYKFANLEDKVNYTITITGEDPLTGESKEYKYSDTMRYTDAAEYVVNPVYLHHTVQVTW